MIQSAFITGIEKLLKEISLAISRVSSLPQCLERQALKKGGWGGGVIGWELVESTAEPEK